MELLQSLLANPNIALPLIAVGVVGLVAFGTYLILRGPRDNKSAFETLATQLLDTKTALAEAERIGRFGSFSWNFEDPSASYWSQGLYAICGFHITHRIPDIDTFYTMAQEADRVRVKEAWDAAKSKAGDFRFECTIVTAEHKPVHVRVQGKTIYLGATQIRRIEGVVQDISAEAEIDKSKSEFVSLASHQLKTPLTSIRWLTEALLSDSQGALTPNQRQYLTSIEQSVLQMIAMVNDLLNVSRIELNKIATQIEQLDAGQMLRTVISEQTHDAEVRKIALTVSVDKDLPPVFADRNSLRMIFQNLVSNAIKYTPVAGSVTCDLVLSRKRDTLYLTVTDTGIGIPKADQEHIFEKLRRASNAQTLVADGTGLGLYVVKTIVEKAGGEISFTSTEGKGSAFYVTIPLMWKTAEAARGAHTLK